MEVHITNIQCVHKKSKRTFFCEHPVDIYIPTQFIYQEGGIQELQEEGTLPAEARVRRQGDRKV